MNRCQVCYFGKGSQVGCTLPERRKKIVGGYPKCWTPVSFRGEGNRLYFTEEVQEEGGRK